MTLVLAFFIRKVKVKGLNDTKYILAAIYLSSIVLAVIIVSTYSLNEFINVNAAVFCTGFFIGTTVILGLVFGPKVRSRLSECMGPSWLQNRMADNCSPIFSAIGFALYSHTCTSTHPDGGALSRPGGEADFCQVRSHHVHGDQAQLRHGQPEEKGQGVGEFGFPETGWWEVVIVG